LILASGWNQRGKASEKRDGLEHDLGLAGVVGLRRR
jgi:hypothetical protein